MTQKRIEYLECACSEIEHLTRFTWWEDDTDPWPDICVDVSLSWIPPWYKRLWYGVKYIFGYRSKYGHFTEALLFKEQVVQLRDICNRYLQGTSEP